MQFQRRPARGLAPAAVMLCSLLLNGCASPGAPRPPSLHLPEPVRDLSAMRSGGEVRLSFSVPNRTTDGLPLKPGVLQASLCRQTRPGRPCDPVSLPPGASALAVTDGDDRHTVQWTDTLPPDLASGAPRTILYRVEVRNEHGRSAGPSIPTAAAAGRAPSPVSAFHAEGLRSGVLLRWDAADSEPGDVLIERQQPAPAPAGPKESRRRKELEAGHNLPSDPRPKNTPGVVWLQADPDHKHAGGTIDGTVEEGVPYRYTAVRRVQVQAGGRMLELRSAPSETLSTVWQDVYPPSAPEGLTAVGFTTPANAPGAPETYAVDLIWQPVRDPRLAGYLVFRTPLQADGTPAAAPQRLTPEPLPTPSFHDTGAVSAQRYRYEVRSVDGKGNISPPAQAEVRSATP